jgi:site-specific DNA recombinase
MTTAIAPTTATVRAALYTRISQDTEGKALGVQRQAKECRELARRRGWSVVEVYTDNDLSAYTGKLRPAYQRLVEDIRAGTINAVIAWHPDRLHRSTRELLDFADMARETGCTVETVQSGDMNLFSPSGKAVAVTLSAWSRYESEQKSERLKAKHRELAAAGKDAGGGRPFGYDPDRKTIRLDEALLIREAAERVLAGEGINGICRDWTARGIKSAKGHAWHRRVMTAMLASTRISGRRERRTDANGKHYAVGIDPVTATWDGIISVEQSDRLRALLSDPGRRPGAKRSRYLLTGGLTVCGLCGAAMVSRPKKRRATLVCARGPGYHGCGHMNIMYEPLESLIVDTVLAAIDTGALSKAMRGHDDKKAIAELAKVEEKMSELARDWAADRLSRKEWIAAREPLEARKRDVQRQVDQGRSAVGLDGIDLKTLHDTFAHLPLHRQKAVVGALVESVVIGPGQRGVNRFDRVSIKWRA